MNRVFLSLCIAMASPVCLAQSKPEISKLVQQLDASKFSERRESHQQILDQCKKSGEHLTEALQQIFDAREGSKSPELRARTMQLTKELVRFEKDLAGYGYLGIRHEAQLFNEKGKNINVVLVSGVGPNSPAEKAGLLAGDIIVGIDRESFGVGLNSGTNLLSEYVLSKKPGEVVNLQVRRDRAPLTLKTKLTARPRDGDAGEIFKQGRQAPLGQRIPNQVQLPPQLLLRLQGFQQPNKGVAGPGAFPTGKTTLDRARERYYNRWVASQKERLKLLKPQKK